MTHDLIGARVEATAGAFYPVCDGTEIHRHLSKRPDGQPVCGERLWRVLPCEDKPELSSFSNCPECYAIAAEYEAKPKQLRLFGE